MALMTSRASMKLMVRMVPRPPRFREDKLGAGQGIDLPRSGRGQAPRKYRRRIFGMLKTKCRWGTFLSTWEQSHSCGHYEGVDERVRAHLVNRELSIGDYILTGGELSAMVVIDAVSR